MYFVNLFCDTHSPNVLLNTISSLEYERTKTHLVSLLTLHYAGLRRIVSYGHQSLNNPNCQYLKNIQNNEDWPNVFLFKQWTQSELWSQSTASIDIFLWLRIEDIWPVEEKIIFVWLFLWIIWTSLLEVSDTLVKI